MDHVRKAAEALVKARDTGTTAAELEAFAALRAALALPAPEPIGYTSKYQLGTLEKHGEALIYREPNNPAECESENFYTFPIYAEPPAPREPVAWQHNGYSVGPLREAASAQAAHLWIISDKVKQLWLKVNPKHVEHYTIPLYAEPPAPKAGLSWSGHNIYADDEDSIRAVKEALHKAAQIEEWRRAFAERQAEPPAPREPDDVIRALRANNGPLSDRERRLAVAAWYAGVAEPKAAPSEIARDAARIPREPTDAMLEAGLAASEPLDLDPICQPEELAAIYRAMYDAAIEQERK